MKKQHLTGGEEWEKHREDSAHVKRRGSSSFPHNHPSSSGSHFTPLPAQTGLRKNRREELEPPSPRWEHTKVHKRGLKSAPSSHHCLVGSFCFQTPQLQATAGLAGAQCGTNGRKQPDNLSSFWGVSRRCSLCGPAHTLSQSQLPVLPLNPLSKFQITTQCADLFDDDRVFKW